MMIFYLPGLYTIFISSSLGFSCRQVLLWKKVELHEEPAHQPWPAGKSSSSSTGQQITETQNKVGGGGGGCVGGGGGDKSDMKHSNTND